jgi:hypothetical protein
MNTKPKTVNIMPNWEAVAKMHIMLIENGTPQGQQEAKQGILEMGQLLDQLIAERGPDVEKILADCEELRDKVLARSKPEARKKGWILVSRGFEFLSLDANGERDENLVDFIDDDKLTAEVIQEAIDDVRKAGSAYLGIGWGVDQADDQEGYDCGDYSPMHDWDDLESIDVRISS